MWTDTTQSTCHSLFRVWRFVCIGWILDSKISVLEQKPHEHFHLKSSYVQCVLITSSQWWLLTNSTFSLDRFLIFSSILWIHCNISSFFLLILLFFSTKGFSWLSVSRERFSCKWQRNKVSCVLAHSCRKEETYVFSLAFFLHSENVVLSLSGIWQRLLLN